MNNPLRYIDPNGMYNAATEDGSEPEEDEWVKKKRQENTWNYMAQVGKDLATGAQLIAEALSDIMGSTSNKVSKGFQNIGEIVLSDGYSVLNEVSGTVAFVSLVGAAGFTAAYQRCRYSCFWDTG